MDEISYVNLDDTLYGMGISDKVLEGAKSDLADVMRPVGSVYVSTDSTNPSELFGGTWTEIKDKFLLAAGDTYTVGATGGAATVTLTSANIPSHTHTLTATGSITSTFTGTAASHTHSYTLQGVSSSYNNTYGSSLYLMKSGTTSYTSGSTSITPKGTVTSTFTGSSTSTGTTGGSAHNNMPPYLVVYMWQRTA